MGFIYKIENLVIGIFLILLAIDSKYLFTGLDFYHPFAYAVIGVIILFMPMVQSPRNIGGKIGGLPNFIRRWVFGLVLLAFGAFSFFPDFLSSLGYGATSYNLIFFVTLIIGAIYILAVFTRTRGMKLGTI